VCTGSFWVPRKTWEQDRCFETISVGDVSISAGASSPWTTCNEPDPVLLSSSCSSFSLFHSLPCGYRKSCPAPKLCEAVSSS
jgi:hypothetical protein